MSYYDDHAEEFVANTVDSDLSQQRARFLKLLPSPAKILDAGCGSGRDSLAFLELGHHVTAFDASKEMAAAASRLTGLPVLHRRFDEITFHNEFDGIWACASLLHVPHEEMLVTLQSLAQALKPQAVLYASFKYGTGEGMRNGRWFVDYDEGKIAAVLPPDLEILQTWITTDVRPQRSSEVWLNVAMRRLS